jgi:hypothetical protein
LQLQRQNFDTPLQVSWWQRIEKSKNSFLREPGFLILDEPLMGSYQGPAVIGLLPSKGAGSSIAEGYAASDRRECSADVKGAMLGSFSIYSAGAHLRGNEAHDHV